MKNTTITIAGVEYEMIFNMNSIQQVMDKAGMGFADVNKMAENTEGISLQGVAKMLDFCLICAFYGIQEHCEVNEVAQKFTKIRQLGAKITNAMELMPAFSMFMKAYLGFYQVDIEQSEELKKAMANLETP